MEETPEKSPKMTVRIEAGLHKKLKEKAVMADMRIDQYLESILNANL